MKEKIIKIFTKPRARTFIKIWTEDPEEWFIEISTCKNKSGEITNTDTIIKKDLNDRIIHLKNRGWIEKK